MPRPPRYRPEGTVGGELMELGCAVVAIPVLLIGGVMMIVGAPLWQWPIVIPFAVWYWNRLARKRAADRGD